jgi:hypothetical protein
LLPHLLLGLRLVGRWVLFPLLPPMAELKDSSACKHSGIFLYRNFQRWTSRWRRISLKEWGFLWWYWRS